MFNKINFLFVTLFGIGKIGKIPGSIASLATTYFICFAKYSFNFCNYNFFDLSIFSKYFYKRFRQ